LVVNIEGGMQAEVVWEVTGDRRKLHNEKLNDLHCSPNIFRAIKMRWAGHIACMGERRGVYRVLVGRTEW
jgi:hypothetical protein